jgi:ubiquinone/menaquinone biosynthesis C-methylase UbiE
MTKIRELYNNIIAKLQEFIYTIGAKKRIQIMSEYIDNRASGILLDIGGNTGKITEGYSNNCKEVIILEPKHSIVEYARSHRPRIKFVEGGAENIPLPDEYFDKVVASASFHHFSDQDSALEEMKRVLKPMIILEIDPNTPRGKRLKFCEPVQLSKKIEEHCLHVLSVDSTTLGYFLTAVKSSQKKQEAN